MKKKSTKVSVGMVARAAGVSVASASVALNNRAGVGAATRKRILRIAKKLGYAPDAKINDWMARVRDAKSKDLLPIAWLNTAAEEDAYRRYLFHSPYLSGAKERALELGFKVEEIWCREPGLTMKRLTKVLYQRGIEGVIITHPARHIRLDWEHLASVALGTSILAPGLHRITGDFCFNFRLALKSVLRMGFRRVGICLGYELDSFSNYTIRAIASAFYAQGSKEERIPPLFHAHFAYNRAKAELDIKARAAEVVAWVKRHKPDVIVCHDNRLVQWVGEAGYRVPDDISIVHLAVDDDVLDWAGIHSGRRKTGAAAVNQLVSLMQNHQYGIPETPLTILIRGTWQSGRTIRAPVRT